METVRFTHEETETQGGSSRSSEAAAHMGLNVQKFLLEEIFALENR